MKHRDPIVDELHWIREAIGKTQGFDIRRIAASIRQHIHQVARFPQKIFR
jgi:hypothetical protein